MKSTKIDLINDTIEKADLTSLPQWLTMSPIPRLTQGKLTEKFEKEFANYVGTSYSVEDFVRLSFSHVGIERWQKYVVQGERFTRPAEIYSLRGDPTKAKNTLGWKPACSFEHMVGKMVDNDIEVHSG
jgi:GDPmannose 4,6-dehydratase